MNTRKKKGRKMRGQRTRGTGHSKKHRGAGHRGGHGNAGSKKGKIMTTHKTRTMGKRNFRAPNPQQPTTINVGRLSELVSESGMKNEIDLIALGYDKLLGSGKVTNALKVRVTSLSPKAKEKIEKAGGEVVLQ